MQAPRISSYRFGRIVIEGRSYHHDVIIFPDRVNDSRWRDQGHSVSISDLQEVLASPPAMLVIGQGNPGLMEVPDITRQGIEAAGIELIVQPTPEASATYNRLRRIKHVVAALHLTC